MVPPFDWDCADVRGFAGDPEYRAPQRPPVASPGAYSLTAAELECSGEPRAASAPQSEGAHATEPEPH